MRLIALALVLCLGGCGGVWHPTRNAEVMTVTWLRLSEAGVRDQCNGAAGCSRMTGESTCVIIAPVPIDDIDDARFAVLGEEVAHCFYGDFH